MKAKPIVFVMAAVAVLLAVILALSRGCGNRPRGRPAGPTGPTFQPRQDHLWLALDTLARYDELDPQKSMLQAVYHLNRWVAQQSDEEPWEPDGLLAQLPQPFRSSPPARDLGKPDFVLEDMRFLREALWMRDLGDWVARQTLAADWDPWLAEVKKTRGEQTAFEIGVTLRLFDWTVRNVQLTPLLPYPTGPAAKPEAERLPSPLEQGIGGPGYTAFPWQTLLFGMGDAWQRARVFILLARQHQLDVVMLAYEEPQTAPRLRPWLPALLIDDQLYLFDTELGLPIPGPDGVGVATLQQVRQDPALLRLLDVGQEHLYTPARAKLESLVALIDAAPPALSHRMRLIEANQSHGKPLVLAVAPARLAERLAKAAGIPRAELWTVPWETGVYQAALDARMETDPGLLLMKLLRDGVFNGLHPIMQGRQRHFRGMFENEDQKDGGKALYLHARLPDSVINRLETSPEVQASLGIVRGRANEQEWKTILRLQKSIALQVKKHATYWLGLIHMDTANNEAALDWLQARTLDSKDENPWKAGARYNLARIYEARGELEQARRLLLLDDSPQKHGNLLRARMLRQKLEKLEAKP